MYEDHEMIVGGSRPDGIELWVCPRCFKIILMKVPEGIVKEVIREGSKQASHSLTKVSMKLREYRELSITLKDMGPFESFLGEL